MMWKCPECDKELERLESSKKLSIIPYEWFLDKDVFKNEVILLCSSCKIYTVLSGFQKLKYTMAEKLLEL